MNSNIIKYLFDTSINILSDASLNNIYFRVPQLKIYAIMSRNKRKLEDEDDSIVTRNKVGSEGDTKVQTSKTLSHILEISVMLSETINQHRKDLTNK